MVERSASKSALAWQLATSVELEPLGVAPLARKLVFGKAATASGSSYIEVELSRMKTTLGGSFVCAAKNAVSPPKVGKRRCVSELPFKQQDTSLDELPGPAAWEPGGTATAASSASARGLRMGPPRCRTGR